MSRDSKNKMLATIGHIALGLFIIFGFVCLFVFSDFVKN